MPKAQSDPKPMLKKIFAEKNRPYSVVNLVDELRGEYTKTVIQKAIDSLVSDGDIICKLCGKLTKLYFQNQENLPVASKEELTQLDQTIDSLSDTLGSIQERRDELRARRDALAATLPIHELREKRVSIEQEAAEAKARQEELIQASAGITPEDSEKILAMFKLRCDQWKKRKAKCMEVVDDNVGKKPKEFMQEMELETDESAGVSLVQSSGKYVITEFAI